MLNKHHFASFMSSTPIYPSSIYSPRHAAGVHPCQTWMQPTNGEGPGLTIFSQLSVTTYGPALLHATLVSLAIY